MLCDFSHSHTYSGCMIYFSGSCVFFFVWKGCAGFVERLRDFSVEISHDFFVERLHDFFLVDRLRDLFVERLRDFVFGEAA